jgi:hypothetical protein
MGALSRRCRCRTAPYLNNVIGQDHRFIKKRITASLGLRSPESACRTPDGYEAMQAVRKGQVRWHARWCVGRQVRSCVAARIHPHHLRHCGIALGFTAYTSATAVAATETSSSISWNRETAREVSSVRRTIAMPSDVSLAERPLRNVRGKLVENSERVGRAARQWTAIRIQATSTCEARHPPGRDRNSPTSGGVALNRT